MMRQLKSSVWPQLSGRRRCNSGTVIVAALVSMLIVMSMLGTLLQGSLRARRQLHAERDLRQTELLVEAALDRAGMRLSREADYRGETWKLPSDGIVGRGDGQVVINASREPSDGPWEVKIVVEYPLGSALSIQRSRTFSVQAQQPPLQEN
jgi:hypothetical protein